MSRIQSLRHVLRRLGRAPLFTGVSILTICEEQLPGRKQRLRDLFPRAYGR